MNILKSILCFIGLHLNWKTVYKDGPREDQTCSHCGRQRHSVYDMCYGGTYYKPGHEWA